MLRGLKSRNLKALINLEDVHLCTQKFGNSEFQQKAHNYYNLDVIISVGYRVKAMTMENWAEHLDKILTMSGEKMLQGAGSISHEIALFK